MKRLFSQRGATLIELVVSIVIISITVTAVMMVIVRTSGSSADPMLRAQATSIAQAYLEEILVQSLDDPEGGETGGAEAGETRATFDDVSDYNGLSDSSGAVDQNGAPLPALTAYNVSVSVSAATLGGHPAKRILVVVTFDGDARFSLSLSAYRLV